MMNLTSHDRLLHEYNDYIRKLWVNEIIFVTIASVLGIFGNAIAFTYFGFKTRRTVSNFLIACLSFNDIMTSIILGINLNVLMMHTVTFANDPACKISMFINQVLLVNSLLMLLLVSIDRYIQFCWSTSRWVLQKRTAIILIVGIVVYTIIHAVIKILILSPAEVIEVKISIDANTTILGYRCVINRSNTEIDSKRFHYYELAVLAVSVLSMIILYSLILRAICKTKASINRHNSQESLDNEMTTCVDAVEADLTSETDTQLAMDVDSPRGKSAATNCDKDTVCAMIENEEARHQNTNETDEERANLNRCTASNATKLEHARESNRNTASDTNETEHIVKKYQPKPNSERKRHTAEKTISLMMLAITGVSLLSFVPYFARARGILQFSFILNSTVNPYIMFFVSSQFRLFVKSVFTCCCRRR